MMTAGALLIAKYNMFTMYKYKDEDRIKRRAIKRSMMIMIILYKKCESSYVDPISKNCSKNF